MVIFLSLMNYIGISFYGAVDFNGSDAVKDMAPKCFLDYIKEYGKECVGTKVLLNGEDEFEKTQAYKDYLALAEVGGIEGGFKCNKAPRQRELCTFEINQSYKGQTGLLRWILMILGVMIALNDLGGMSQSVFAYQRLDNQPHVVHRVTFIIYCVLRCFFVYWALIIILQFCYNGFFFRQPMDLCMNFAALAFIMDIDDIVCSLNYFILLKTKYQLFSNQEYAISDIENIGSIG